VLRYATVSIAILYALLHLLLLLRRDLAPADDPPMHDTVHLLLGAAIAAAALLLRHAMTFGVLCFFSFLAAASALPKDLKFSVDGAAALIIRGILATALGALCLALAVQYSRPIRKRFAISAGDEPQRLLELAKLRRQIIIDTLALPEDEIDRAVFAPISRLRSGLSAANVTPAQRHLIALGLLICGQLDALPLLYETVQTPAPPATLQALKLTLPLPSRLQRRSGFEPILIWMKKKERRLKWSAESERYVL
jgi:hypothetical protein